MSALREQAGVKDGDDMMAKMLEKMSGVPPGILAEGKEIDRLRKGGFAELRQSGDTPDVPTYVLLGGKRDPTPSGQTFPGDMEAYFKAGMEQRIDHFGRMM